MPKALITPTEAPEFPWEQQPKESIQAFRAFAHYRDAGEDRGIRKTAQALGKNHATIAQFSSRWRWVERVAAYEAYLDEKTRHELEKARIAAKKRQAQIGQSLQATATRELVGIQARQQRGEAVLAPRDVPRFIDVGARIENEALGTAENDLHDREELALFKQIVMAAIERRSPDLAQEIRLDLLRALQERRGQLT